MSSKISGKHRVLYFFSLFYVFLIDQKTGQKRGLFLIVRDLNFRPMKSKHTHNIRQNSKPGFLIFVFGRTLTYKAVKPTNLQSAAFNNLATNTNNKIGQVRTDDNGFQDRDFTR